MNNTDFDGLIMDEITGPYIEYVKGKLDKRRLGHSVETARLAAELAGRNKVSPSRATVAGLIHDIARPFTDDKLLAIAGSFADVTDYERSVPKLLHGAVAARMAREDMGCEDDEILFAVRHHTCGHPNICTLGKCLMVADYAEAGRNFDAVREIRKQLTCDLDDVLLKIIVNKLVYLEEQGVRADPRTLLLKETLARGISDE